MLLHVVLIDTFIMLLVPLYDSPAGPLYLNANLDTQ